MSEVRLLDDVAEDVVAAVTIDDDELGVAYAFEGCEHVGDDRVQGGRADADGAFEVGVLVRAADRDGGQEHQLVVGRDAFGDR